MALRSRASCSATWEWRRCCCSWRLPAADAPAPSGRDRRAQLRRGRERLQYHAVALGQPQQRVELLGRGGRVELEAQPYRREADRCLAVDAERAAEVELSLGGDVPAGDRDLQRGGHRA